MEKRRLSFNAKAIHAGSEPCPTTGAHVAPVYRTSTFVIDNVERAIRIGYGEEEGYSYGRFGNPTVDALQEKIASLENAEAALATASGMAAISTALMAELQAGDHIVTGDIIYGCTYGFVRDLLPQYGIEVTMVDTTDPKNIEEAIKPNTKIVYIETPSNPVLGITDIEKSAELAHANGAKLFVDNTWATPYLQNPLNIGADVVLHSATKYLNGHGDIVGGAIVGSKELMDKIKAPYLEFFGGIMSPMDAAEVSKGIKTLGVRMEKHCQNAKKIAEFLEGHHMVERVLYPGVETHPQHELAKKQMKDFGGMMSFDVKGGAKAGKALMNSVELVSLATSLGCVDSLIQHSPSMSHATMSKEERERVGITEGQVRLSVGIEEPENVIADLKQALEQVEKVID
ncbi:trans-sulfuration enzyme family protein [Natranaerobius thermophilus]|uniref:homocysteine desulfhydrase n=1 Tax=Natranaerobius thermophilus (strain ATCC BAA-1301 / DSM 18059 / JW/NM-WN-LF) TaxID=457570 RepID=B2A1K3_NATTJ|nr:PLP-dependent aspartate aminotransferase family protein [Natranaerobius thermophilus]ACB84743.1 cystathionine gamma-synthase [Natranaerobius thermophilus JW/NM-WN-LF]